MNQNIDLEQIKKDMLKIAHVINDIDSKRKEINELLSELQLAFPTLVSIKDKKMVINEQFDFENNDLNKNDLLETIHLLETLTIDSTNFKLNLREARQIYNNLIKK